MDAVLISERFKEIRLVDLGMNHRELALKLGISKPMVSFIENVENPKELSKNVAIDLATMSKVSLDYIFGLSDVKYYNKQGELGELLDRVHCLNAEKQRLVIGTLDRILQLA